MCSNNLIELEYVVLKVNGKDVSHLPKYEAVELFLQAKNTPIVVELCRQSKDDNGDEISAMLGRLDLIKAKTSTSSASTNMNLSSINSISSPKENQIIFTLRDSSVVSEPAIETIYDPTRVLSKETQTLEEFIEENHAPNDQDIVQTIADHFIEEEHNLFEQCLEPEIDIEEITLLKEIAPDPIGINLCCNTFLNNYCSAKNVSNNNSQSVATANDACVDVFISDIQPESIAGRDGRLRRGDQILRINGRDIKNKEDVETQMAENMAVTLLVSRLLYPEDDDDDDDEYYVDSNFEYENSFLTEEYTNVVDKLGKVFLAQAQTIKSVIEVQKTSTPTLEVNAGYKNFAKTNDTLTENQISSEQLNILSSQKSTVENNVSQEITSKPAKIKNLTSVKSKHYDYDETEHIYETIPEDSESEPLYCSPYQSSTYMTAMGSCSSATMGETLQMHQQSQRVAQWLGIKSNQTHIKAANTLTVRPNWHSKHISSNRVSTLRSALTNTSESSSSGAGYSAFGAKSVDNDNFNEELDNSSSAYNTGGSNNSPSPLVFALNKNQNVLQDNEIIAANDKNVVISSACVNKSLVPSLPSPSTKEPFVTSPLTTLVPIPKSIGTPCCETIGKISTDDLMSTFNSSSIKVCESGPQACKIQQKLLRLKQPDDQQQTHCPQFNAPNLSHYHFVSCQEVASANKSKRQAVVKPSSIIVTKKGGPDETPMVWKVKRRPDGTRYIVKRPVRNRIHVGIRKNVYNNDIPTTEDDTISEVKIGRYWTKEERKRHIERARERRHYQQQLQQQFPIQ